MEKCRVPLFFRTCALAATCGCGGAAGAAAVVEAGAKVDPIDATSVSSDSSHGPPFDADSESAPEADLADITSGPALTDTCDGGYFFEIDDDAGARRLTSGCSDAGPNVPLMSYNLCAEDCLCTVVTACEGPASFTFSSGCFKCGVGSCGGRTTYADGDGGPVGGVATLQIARFPEDGGAVEGLYTGTLTTVVDGGSTTGAPVSGHFCVLYAR
jgi:hypothetical protein